ncbi:MAG: response regulator [Methylococcaceae bacterium]
MQRNTYTLLVIEDDYFQQELLKIWLEAENYKVVLAANGEQALNVIAEYKPDLILLDLVMPGLDGFQVAKQLKENPETRQIPVVVVTVVDAPDKRIEALKIGVDDFLNKPVDRIELLVRVKNLLQSRTYFKQLQNRQAHLLQLENLASIGTLIDSVTKEINTPLQGLQQLVALAQEQYADNPELLDLSYQATNYIDRIDLVVHNMQLYIKSISVQSSTETCQVTTVLAQVLELLSNKMLESNIQIQTHLAANLARVQCSSEGLMHVLVHLLLNAYEAVQHCELACIKITVEPSDAKQLIISVCDNNAEAENLYSLIVDPLFSTKLPQACNSLGLALACHFIEKSGGSISIDSTSGCGSCMKVVLKTV